MPEVFYVLSAHTCIRLHHLFDSALFLTMVDFFLSNLAQKDATFL